MHLQALASAWFFSGHRTVADRHSRDLQLASTFSTMMLNQPQQHEWHFNSGTTSHMASDPSSLSDIFSQRYPIPSNIIVGDGSLLPITSALHNFRLIYLLIMFLFHQNLLRI
jgi:hypothetical protein